MSNGRCGCWLVAAVCCAVGSVGATRDAAAQPGFSLRAIPNTTGCTVVTHAPGDRTRAYALERIGRIRIIQNGAALAQPYLDFSGLVTSSGESGALGLAFDPQFESNGYFYVAHMSNSAGQPRYAVVRYQAASAQATTVDPATRTIIMPLVSGTDTPSIHNGGWIGFGPDGMLYISRGEGPRFGQAGQDPTLINGKVLRIDVRSDAYPADATKNYAIPADNPFASGVSGTPEVWVMGLRNPYRCSFDRQTGDLWIGDVGTAWEEINIVRPGDAAPVNFGWPCIDGARPWPTNGTNLCATPSPRYRLPAFSPPRSGTGFTATCLIGGFVYRGPGNPGMQGRYAFNPSCYSSRIGSVDALDPTSVIEHVDFGATPTTTFGFGEDAEGEMYLCTITVLYKFMPPVGMYTDCNNNAVVDAVEIADGRAMDVNGDGIPDSCTRLCAADVDASGSLSVGDLFLFLNQWFTQAEGSDINADGQVSVQDIFDYLGLYFSPCP